MSLHDPELLDVDLDAPEQSRRPVVAGVAAGLWALLVGLALVTCLVMAAWAVSPNSAGDSAAAWRAAGSVWLGAHQVPLEIGGRELTLLPLGSLLLGLLVTRRGGRWAGRLLAGTTPSEVVGIVGSCALVYAAGGAGVAWLADGPGTGASPPTAFLWTGMVALVGATWGIAREADLVAWCRARVSDAAWRTAMGALAAVLGMFAMGAVLVTVSLIRHFGQITATMADLDAGPVGTLALTVLGALCLPSLDIWGMSVVVGPGFDLGSAGALNVLGGQVQSLPALPVLAAIPTTVPAWGPVLLVVPVALGVLGGRIRWGRDLPTLTGAVASGAGLAGVVAALVAGLVLLGSGSLGGGRLAEVGPRALPVAAAAAGLVLLGFLGEAAFQSVRLSWELHQAEQRAEDRRLRLAARGLADPEEPAEVDAQDAEIEDVVEAGPAHAGPGHAGPVQADGERPTGSAPRREPPPVRESIAIPVLVTSPMEESMPQAEDAARPEAGAPADTVIEPADEVQAVESAGTETSDSASPVDLTRDEPADVDLAEAASPVAGESEDGAAVWDGDSTVDLTVDPADMAEIRAAQRDSSSGDDATVGMG